MKNLNLIFCLIFLMISITGFCQTTENLSFEKLNNSDEWNLEFSDSGTRDYSENWHLDGKIAKIKNTPERMNLIAGPEFGNDAHHMVLWTKKSFNGDVKIEFDYTRTDHETKAVNIIYIQATGKEEGDFVRDIFEWNDLRSVPSMRTYFNNMKTLHISYAAFPNDEQTQDYVRVRRYPVSPEKAFRELEVEPTYFDTGLFKTGITYKITAIKTDNCLFFKVEGDGLSKIFFWNTSHLPPLTEGRIGIRHMYTRSALYKNFKVFTK